MNLKIVKVETPEGLTVDIDRLNSELIEQLNFETAGTYILGNFIKETTDWGWIFAFPELAKVRIKLAYVCEHCGREFQSNKFNCYCHEID